MDVGKSQQPNILDNTTHIGRWKALLRLTRTHAHVGTVMIVVWWSVGVSTYICTAVYAVIEGAVYTIRTQRRTQTHTHSQFICQILDVLCCMCVCVSVRVYVVTSVTLPKAEPMHEPIRIFESRFGLKFN